MPAPYLDAARRTKGGKEPRAYARGLGFAKKNRLFGGFFDGGTYTDEDFKEQRAIVVKKLEDQYLLIEESRGDEFNMDEALGYCFEFVSNATKTWLELGGNHQARIRFQNLIFKARLPFDGEKFGNTELSPIFQLKETLLLEESLLVAPKTIIMNLFGLAPGMVPEMNAWSFEMRAWLAKEPIQETLAVTY